MKELVNLYQAYPKKIPLRVVADLIGINEEGLKANIQSGNCPFGLGYKLTGKGNRISVIPTLTFLIWYTKGEILKEINYV